MKPVAFKEQTKVLAKPSGMTDEECGTLPVFNDGLVSVSCWKAQSFKERIKFLFTGVMWLGVYFSGYQPPVYLTTDKPIDNKSELNEN